MLTLYVKHDITVFREKVPAKAATLSGTMNTLQIFNLLLSIIHYFESLLKT